MKRIFSALFIIHCSLIIVYAQPTQQWVQKYSWGYSASGLSVKLDSMGFIYVLMPLDSLQYYGPSYFGLVKYSQSGAVIWSARYFPPGFPYVDVYAFDVSANGDVYMTGNAGNTSSNFMLTVKFNSSGALQWSRPYYPSGGGRDIKIDRQGNIIVVGAQWVGTQVGSMVVKYDPSGDTLWARGLVVSSQGNYLQDCAIDGSNNVLATGVCYPDSERAYSLNVKYDPNGSLLWYLTYYYYAAFPSDGGVFLAVDLIGNAYVLDASGYNQGTCNTLLKIDPSGSLIWASAYKGIGNNGEVSFTPANVCVSSDGTAIYYATQCQWTGGFDFIALKYNPSGDSAWVRRYPNSDGSEYNPSALALDINADAYITGRALISGIDNGIIIKYMNSGIKQWTVILDSSASNSVAVDSGLSVYVTGSGLYARDAVTIKYNQPNGIQKVSNNIPGQSKLFQNYPNPFNPITKIKMQITKSSKVKLTVYDILGRELAILVNQQLAPGTYETEWNAPGFSSGMYFYELTVDNKIIDSKKLVLLK